MFTCRRNHPATALRSSTTMIPTRWRLLCSSFSENLYTTEDHSVCTAWPSPGSCSDHPTFCRRRVGDRWYAAKSSLRLFRYTTSSVSCIFLAPCVACVRSIVGHSDVLLLFHVRRYLDRHRFFVATPCHRQRGMLESIVNVYYLF